MTEYDRIQMIANDAVEITERAVERSIDIDNGPRRTAVANRLVSLVFLELFEVNRRLHPLTEDSLYRDTPSTPTA